MGSAIKKLLIGAAAGLLISMPAAATNDHGKGPVGEPLSFHGTLTGAQESPPVDTDVVGTVTARFDAGFTRVTVRIRLKGDITVVAGHFHCARPGANGGIPFGLMTPGPLTEIVDNTRVTLTNEHFTGADCSGTAQRPINNIAALALAMRDGFVYLNLHSPTSPGGQIRAQMIED